MKIEQAHVEDAAEILTLQKLAYQSEAAIWNDYTIPPLTQTFEEITAEFDKQRFLKVMRDGRIIGSLRAYQRDGTCYIGRVIVHPDLQNQGIGKQLMTAVEAEFPEVRRFELFTGQKSTRNLYFYQKLGYRIFKEKPLNANIQLVYLEKMKENPHAND